MFGFRKKRRPGNRPPTTAEANRIVASKEGRCMPCLSWAQQGYMQLQDVVVGVDYDHSKSGNIRRGHDKGFGSCTWHHRKHPVEGMTTAETRAKYGPSLMDGGKTFAAAYGTDDELIALQTMELGHE